MAGYNIEKKEEKVEGKLTNNENDPVSKSTAYQIVFEIVLYIALTFGSKF